MSISAPQHLEAAWDLAGHADDPDAVREKVLAYAHEHDLLDHLPASAHDWLQDRVKIKKAKQDDIRALLADAFAHEQGEGDTPEQRNLVHFAASRHLTQLLPPAAHGLLHELGVRHNHAELENEDQPDGAEPDDPFTGPGHVHTVTKAFNPGVTFGRIEKAWGVDGSEAVHFEGWLSTPHKDIERDITEPEAFLDSLPDYFARSAPLSIEHDQRALPVGHLQKGAILRDGKVLLQAEHPTDPAEFEHLPATGSGVWVRGVANEPRGASAVRKGNVGGMSFIGNFTHYEPLPGGGKRYTRIDPLIEGTIAAYPVNPKAALRIAKAFGLQEQHADMDKTLEEILAEAGERLAVKKQAELDAAKVQKGITAENLGDLLAQFQATMLAKMDEIAETKVQKALPARPEGAGRKGSVPASGEASALTLESDPGKYLVMKARKGEELNRAERDVAEGIFKHVMSQGLEYYDDEQPDYIGFGSDDDSAE